MTRQSFHAGIGVTRLIDRLHAAVMAGGSGRTPRRPDAAAAGREAWRSRDANSDSLALDADARAGPFADLGARLAEICETEVAALDATAKAVGR